MAKMMRARYRVEMDAVCVYGCCDNRLDSQTAKQAMRAKEKHEVRKTVKEETE